jgi:hypothetical protein
MTEIGRPRIRRLENVGRDRREMKVESWLQQAVSTAKWASVIMALRERQIQIVCKVELNGIFKIFA